MTERKAVGRNKLKGGSCRGRRKMTREKEDGETAEERAIHFDMDEAKKQPQEKKPVLKPCMSCIHMKYLLAKRKVE